MVSVGVLLFICTVSMSKTIVTEKLTFEQIVQKCARVLFIIVLLSSYICMQAALKGQRAVSLLDV